MFIHTVLQVVFFCRPTLCFPSECHISDAVTQILLLSVCKTWPIHLHLFYIIISLFVVSALQCNFSLDIVSGRLILNICPKHIFCIIINPFISLAERQLIFCNNFVVSQFSCSLTIKPSE